MDIIDVSPDDLWVPADTLNGRLGEMLGGDCYSIDEALGPIYDINDGWRARDALRRVLAAGERCEACGGSGRITGRVTWPDADCERCNGTGYTRQPHDLGHFIDAEIAGRITPRVAAGLWWCSVLRVEAGMGPVVGWDDLYQNNTDACSVERWCNARTWWTHGPEQRDYFTAPSGTGHLGWEWGTNRGMETGEAAAACLNRAALSAGFALLNDDHILLPLPDRIARLRLED